MRGSALSKSWDDVFPDHHPPDFFVSTDSDNEFKFAFDVTATSSKHWRSSSATEMESRVEHKSPARSFRNSNENLSCVQTGSDSGNNYSKTQHLAFLEKDVAELQLRFQHEQAVNKFLNQALGQASPIPIITTAENLTSKPTQELIQDIAMLELEVAHLERRLLCLYRKTHERNHKQFSSHSNEQNAPVVKAICDKQQQLQLSSSRGREILSDKGRCQSQSLSESWQKSSNKDLFLPEARARQSISACTSLNRDMKISSYSQPIVLPQEQPEWFLHVPKLENHSIDSHKSREGTPCRAVNIDNLIGGYSPLPTDQRFTTPNKLAQDLVCCMASIYCKLADPPVPPLESLVSPSLSSSSASTFSTQRFSSDGCTLQFKSDGSGETPPWPKYLPDAEGIRSSRIQVEWISVDSDRLSYAARMLRTFRSLVQQLERVDPRQMKHEEKLAFWINIHNALMMHAYLAYGIPRNHLKRVALLQKAAYKVGEHSVNVQTIEQTILKCRWNRPAKWLQSILSPTTKLKVEERQAYAIDCPEPLLYFALCCGGRSDPVVRVYTEKYIYQELEVAKQEFLRTNVNILSANKVQLPWILDSYAKDSSMKPSRLLEWVCEFMEERVATSLTRLILKANGKPHKCIEWMPYDFTFRYVFLSPLTL